MHFTSMSSSRESGRHAEGKCSTEERGLSNDKWCHLQQRLSLLHKSGTIKNIILFHANQVISHLCFFNDKVEYPILLQAGATLPKIGARYITAIPSSVRGQDNFLSIRRNVPNQGVANNSKDSTYFTSQVQ